MDCSQTTETNGLPLNGDQPRTVIDYAEWPRDAPSVLERNVITIICGNTRLHWALHEGCVNKFIPIMFWHTAHDDEHEHQVQEGSDDEDTDAKSSPCDILEAHVASQAHTLIFGEPTGKKVSARSVSKTAAKRDAPGISVFVVSSNPTMEHKICHMFRDVPAKIFKLRNTDFFTAEQGIYPTMGVDRAAALYGAKLHYGAPTLVIDGGTAMTYTMLDGTSTIAGGGISPGVKIRLQSLADYTGSLPTIDHKQFKSAVEGAIEARKPLPFFAKDTETAMISPVCAELSCQLRNIIKQYIARCQWSGGGRSSASTTEGEGTAETASTSTEQKRYPVIITGGDGKFLKDLLQADASGIISVEPDASPVHAHTIELRHVKNLVTYALGDVLYEKFCQKPKNDPEEKLRLKIQGLRIAAPAIDQKEIFSRGCVFNTTPASTIEGYIFHARFDNGMRVDLTLKELYDGLVLYNEIGERPEPIGVDDHDVDEDWVAADEDWVTEKKMWSKKVQEELGNVSRLIRNRIRQLKPHIEKGELAEIFKQRSSMQKTSLRQKKRRRSTPMVSNPIGKRVAKRFPIVNGESMSEAEDVVDQIFFGTVEYISDNLLKWYFIRYDDGDSEELNMEEVAELIDLYEFHKYKDPRHKDDVENERNGDDLSEQEPCQQAKPKCLLPSGSAPSRVLLLNDMDDKEDGGTTYTDLSTLLGLSAEGAGSQYVRRISEFKEDN